MVEEVDHRDHADHDHDDDRPFTPLERKQIRDLLQKQGRVDWFWSTLRVWATWIAAVVAGLYAAGEFLSRFIKIKIGG